jgi:UDP-glucose 6-dehydrogenase
MQQARNHLNDISYCEDAYDCPRDADGLVIITEWEEFRHSILTVLRASWHSGSSLIFATCIASMTCKNATFAISA